MCYSPPFSFSFSDTLIIWVFRHGDPFTISLMGRMQTVINSPETIKFVFSTAYASFPGGYSAQLYRLLSEGKFGDERHLHFRKIIFSAASRDGLQKLVPFISSLAEKTVKVLGESSCSELGGGVA